jgi:site-specific DNA-methyltransferase (adenine-specific)
VTDSPAPFATIEHEGVTLRFFLGDCLEWLPRLPAHGVDAVVTSPPYNLGIRYNAYEDTLPRQEYLAWTGRWVGAVKEVLAPGGSLFLNVGAKPKDPWVAMDIAQAVRPHLHLQNTIHWVKSIVIEQNAAGARAGLARDLAVGHYKPINSDRFLNDCHEFIFHFTPGGATPLERTAIGVRYQDASNVGRWQASAGGLRCRGNAWFLPYETINSREKDRPHPATFPVRLPEYCLRLHGLDRLRLVVDPFTGLGNTAVACALLGIDFVGMDLDAQYLEVAVARAREALSSLGALFRRRTPAARPDGAGVPPRSGAPGNGRVKSAGRRSGDR